MERAVSLFFVIIGAGFAAIGLLFINYGLPRTTTLSCDRSQSQIHCSQHESTAGFPTGEYSLQNVQRFELDSFQVPVGEGDVEAPRFQILITSPQGPLTFGISSNPHELQPTLDKLIHFQNDLTATTITVSGNTASWPQLAAGLAATTLGSSVALAAAIGTKGDRFP